MDRKDLREKELKIEKLKEELIDLQRTPFRVGYPTLIECAIFNIQFEEKKLIEWQQQYNYERTGYKNMKSFLITKDDGSLEIYTNAPNLEFERIDGHMNFKTMSFTDIYIIDSNVITYCDTDELIFQLSEYINGSLKFEELDDGLQLMIKL